ncbi:hypothetical protein BC834DRAFT_876697 [Gloeopeniophorella convolvens]|nr:hypothetical protein BC834DRAFT_876697 [Gloeopeniophorella convolvens]
MRKVAMWTGLPLRPTSKGFFMWFPETHSCYGLSESREKHQWATRLPRPGRSGATLLSTHTLLTHMTQGHLEYLGITVPTRNGWPKLKIRFVQRLDTAHATLETCCEIAYSLQLMSGVVADCPGTQYSSASRRAKKNSALCERQMKAPAMSELHPNGVRSNREHYGRNLSVIHRQKPIISCRDWANLNQRAYHVSSFDGSGKKTPQHRRPVVHERGLQSRHRSTCDWTGRPGYHKILHTVHQT